MKILLANKFYYRRGGDCIYVLNLEQLLNKNGHEVAVFSMEYSENLETKYSKYFPSEIGFSIGTGFIKAFTRPFGTSEVIKKFNQLLDDFKPDVVHLNNIHTQISPVVAELAHKRGVRVVWTLHDYKLLCPRYDCLCKGNDICEKCFSDKRHVLKNKCMKNSLLASVLAYCEAKRWNKKRLENCTDLFICPSFFMKEKMEQGGFDSSKLVTLCNFIDIEKCKCDNYIERNDYYCFIGRLSHEKGINTLISAASKLPYKLKVIGGGPLMDELKGKASKNIEFVGYKDWDEIKDLVGHARFSVIPSEWYENNPLSVIEAECLGTPVLGANIGGIPDLINQNNGMIFESRNVEDLSSKIERMWNMSSDYNSIAKDSQNRYNSDFYYNEIFKIYNGK